MTLPARPTQIFDLQIQWIGAHSANQWPTDDQKPKIAVCNHRAQGSVPGMDSWFSNPIAQASANLGIPTSPGSIHEYVDLVGRSPYANGVAYDQTPSPTDPRLLRNFMSVRARDWSKNFAWISQNKWTISIEFAGKYGEPLTPFQIEAGAKLNAYIILNSDQSLIPHTAEDMMWSHHEFDAINRAHCHGFTAQEWSAMKTRAQQIIDQANQGDQHMTPEERAEIDAIKREQQTLRDDFMYWVIGSHKPWLENLDQRVKALESAIPVIRDVLGQQGQRIQALESRTPTGFPIPMKSAQDPSLKLDHIAKILQEPQAPQAPQEPQEPRSALNPFPDAHGDMPPELQNL